MESTGFPLASAVPVAPVFLLDLDSEQGFLLAADSTSPRVAVVPCRLLSPASWVTAVRGGKQGGGGYMIARRECGISRQGDRFAWVRKMRCSIELQRVHYENERSFLTLPRQG